MTPVEEETSGAAGRRAAGRGANVARTTLGLFYLGSAVFNAVVSYPNARSVYRAFVDLSWPGFDVSVREVILPMAQPFTLAVVAFEFVIGAAILSRGRWVRLAIAAAAAWLVALIPFLSVYGLVNVALAPAVAILLRWEYPAPFFRGWTASAS